MSKNYSSETKDKFDTESWPLKDLSSIRGHCMNVRGWQGGTHFTLIFSQMKMLKNRTESIK